MRVRARRRAVAADLLRGRARRCRDRRDPGASKRAAGRAAVSSGPGRRDHIGATPLARYTRNMFDPAVFAARRDAYMQAIGPDGVAIVRSLPERLRNGDSFHRFRQLSDLVYLTGFV